MLLDDFSSRLGAKCVDRSIHLRFHGEIGDSYHPPSSRGHVAPAITLSGATDSFREFRSPARLG